MSGTWIAEAVPAGEIGDRKVVFAEAYSPNWLMGNDGVARPYAQPVIQALVYQRTGGSWKFVNPVPVPSLFVVRPEQHRPPHPIPLSSLQYEEQMDLVKKGLARKQYVVQVSDDMYSSIAFADTTVMPTHFGNLKAVGQVFIAHVDTIAGGGPPGVRAPPPRMPIQSKDDFNVARGRLTTSV